MLEADFPWYRPLVSVQIDDGRNPAGPAPSMALGETAFFGMTWGSYCADVQSFKRPSPDALLGFEWTARDLDRAYYSGQVASFSTPVPTVPQSQLPALTNVAVGGNISFQFTAPVPLHYGVALWTDPAALGLSGSGVHTAGRAGVVLIFDLQAGQNQITFACAHCSSTTFPYAT